MAIVQSGLHQAEVEEGVQRAQRALAPEVVRIRYSIGNDWTGDPSIFFRVLLSDQASQPDKLQEIAELVMFRVVKEVRSDDFGIHAYFNFRSSSEQEMLKEQAWA